MSGDRSAEVMWWACLFVCLSVRSHISETTCPSFTKFSVHVTRGRGSVLLQGLCDTLCTSGLWMTLCFRIAVVTCAGERCKNSVTAETTASIPTKFCWTINTSKCPSFGAHAGQANSAQRRRRTSAGSRTLQPAGTCSPHSAPSVEEFGSHLTRGWFHRPSWVRSPKPAHDRFSRFCTVICMPNAQTRRPRNVRHQ